MNSYIALGVVWIVCACASLLIAQNRGVTNGALWFFVGLVFGPLGLLVTAVAAKGPVSASAGAADHLARLQAARDGGLLTPAQYQSEAAALAISTIAPPTGKAGAGMQCGKCGKPLSPAWVAKCQHCGARYEEYAPVARPV